MAAQYQILCTAETGNPENGRTKLLVTLLNEEKSSGKFSINWQISCRFPHIKVKVIQIKFIKLTNRTFFPPLALNLSFWHVWQEASEKAELTVKSQIAIIITSIA